MFYFCVDIGIILYVDFLIYFFYGIELVIRLFFFDFDLLIVRVRGFFLFYDR